MTLVVPDFSVVCLLGVSSSGKSTLARRLFQPTEVLSSDMMRALISDDENDQSVSRDAFDLLQSLLAKRLAHRRFCVIDATNTQSFARRQILDLAKRFHAPAIAVVLDVPLALAIARAAARSDRTIPIEALTTQHNNFAGSLAMLAKEGFASVQILTGEDEISRASLERLPLACDHRNETGPFDLIGDVHGCVDELNRLLTRLGYQPRTDQNGALAIAHPQGRKAVFLGDIADRGPDIPGCYRIVMAMVQAGSALMVPGNHDERLRRKLTGREVAITHGLAESLAQIDREPAAWRDDLVQFLASLPTHLWLDGGRLIAAHAGLREDLQGRDSRTVRSFALYGESKDEPDEDGLKQRIDWAKTYRGRTVVVYGHTPVTTPAWVHRTLCVDTGCVYGGALTALRYPERELVRETAEKTYYPVSRPFLTPVAEGM